MSALDEDDTEAGVVVDEGASLTLREVVDRIHDDDPDVAAPRYVEPIDDLPRRRVRRVLQEWWGVPGVTDETWGFRARGEADAGDRGRQHR